MAPTSKAGNVKTGKSTSFLSNPKTPVQMKGALKASGTSKGCPRKNTGKENIGAPVSPLGGEINAASFAPGSDEPTGENTQTSVADENHILREHLAKDECELDILLISFLISHTLVVNLAAVEAAERKHKHQEDEEAKCATAEKITMLVRLKGEAGNTKKGFNLQEAMGLNTSSDKAVLYNKIMVHN